MTVPSCSEPFGLRLYVASGTPNSVAAEANLRLALTMFEHRPGVEIIDVFKHPSRALRDGVLVTPTLLRVQGDAISTMVGRLEPPDVLKRFLG